MIESISDVTTSALKRALDGLDRRQRAITANVANIETPGYIARKVSFEDSLDAATRAGRPDRAAISVTQSMAPTRVNGNNVNIDMEILAGQENQLRQQLAIRGLNNKYTLLRTAISGR